MSNDEAGMTKAARMFQTRNGPRSARGVTPAHSLAHTQVTISRAERWLRPLRFVIISALGYRPSSFVCPWIPLGRVRVNIE
jgi:hypothetical protein